MNDFRITQLPEKWTLKAFEHCCTKISKSYKPIENGTTKYIGLEHIQSGFPKLIGIGIESDIRSSKTQFCVNDVLFGKLRPYLRKAILAEFNGICSTDIFVFRSDEKILPRFLIYLVHSDPFVKYAISTTTGVNHPRTSWNAIKNIKIPVPPIKEQKIIASVLSLVQKAIAQQEKAIALTTELKKALMQKLFTEGTRNEPQKQTEIGLIPKSWDLIKLDNCCKFLSGGTPSKQKQEYWNGDIPWVSPKDMKIPRLDKTINYITQEGLNKGSKLSPKDSILIVIRGMILAKNVPVAILNIPMAFNQDIKAIIPQKSLNNEFILYSLQYHKESLLSKVGTSAHGTKTLSTGEIKQFQVAKPSQEEQNYIISTLKNLEYKIDLQKRQSLILQDLFQTLLHQLMTAKILVSELNLESLDLEEKD